MYDNDELPPPPPRDPAPHAAPLWAVAVLTVAALGVALGAAAPRAGAGTPPRRAEAAPRPAAPAPQPRPDTTPRPATPEWMDLGPVEPGRSYAPVGGPVGEVVSLPDAPAVPVGPAPRGESAAVEPATQAQRAADVPAERAPEPRPVRRSPAAGLRAAAAAELPLLAVRRGSGRIVFHELAAGGTAGAELEGEWAVVGRCGERLRLDLAQPARSAGAPRGVGVDVSGAGAWDAAVAVPAQGCRAARTLHPRRPTPADRERFAAAAGAFAPEELQQVAAAEGAAWLVFAARGRSRAVVAVRDGGAWREVWSRDADGSQEVPLVLRRGGAWEGVFLSTRGGSPDAFQRVRVTDAGAHPDAPAPLGG